MSVSNRKKVLREKLTAMTLVGFVTFWTMSGGKYDSGGDVQAQKVLASNSSYTPTSYTAEYSGNINKLSLSSGTYKFTDVTIGGADTESALTIESDATVHIWLEGTNSFRGGNGVSRNGGGAGIYVPESATLFIHGTGNLIASGGKGGNAGDGSSPEISGTSSKISAGFIGCGGDGGDGGDGGGGGGAGIGTPGGQGGKGGQGGQGGDSLNGKITAKVEAGKPGSSGSHAQKCGEVYFLNTGKITLDSGSKGKTGAGGNGADGSYYSEEHGAATGGGGGGGGGASGSDGHKFGTGGIGGAGGGGGGGGAGQSTEYPVANGGGGGGGGQSSFFNDTKTYYVYKSDVEYTTNTENPNALGGGSGGGGGGGGADLSNAGAGGNGGTVSTGTMIPRPTDNWLTCHPGKEGDTAYRSKNTNKDTHHYGYGGMGGGNGAGDAPGAGGRVGDHTGTHINNTYGPYGTGSGIGGDGGSSDQYEGEVGKAYVSPYTSYNFESSSNVEDINLSTLSILQDGSNLVAQSSISDNLVKFQWLIDGVQVANTPTLALEQSYIGKKITLVSTSSGQSQDELQAVGENQVEYTLNIDLQDCTLKPTNTNFFKNENSEKYQVEYSGEKIDPQLVIYYADIKLTEGTHYTLSFPSDNDLTYPSTDIKIKVNPVTESGVTDSKENTEQSLSFIFDIVAATLNESNCSLSQTDFTYNAHEQKPIVTVAHPSSDSNLLEDTHYTIQWPQDIINASEKTIKITGIESAGYFGEVELEYNILPADINSCSIMLSNSEFPFNGDPIKPNVTIKNGELVLIEGSDYSVIWPEDITSASNKTLTINGMDNYTGNAERSYSIVGTDISTTEILPADATFKYNRQSQKPTFTIKNGNTTLTELNHYTVEFPEDTISCGTKNVVFKGNPQYGYTGEKTVSYEITPVDANDPDLEVKLNGENFYYNGSEMMPEVIAKYLGEALQEGIDYTLTWDEDLTSPGDKRLYVNFQGNFKGTREMTYTIKKLTFEITYGDQFEIPLKDYFNSSSDDDYYHISGGNGLLNATVNGKKIVISSQSPVGTHNLAVNKNGDQETVSIEIIIEKATPILRLNNKTVVYSGEEVLIDPAEVILKNGEEFNGSVNYNYYSNPECTSFISENPRNAGVYYVKADIAAPTDNYKDTSSEPAKITIEKANQILSGTTFYQGSAGTTIQMDAKSNSATDMMYTSDNDSIVSVDDSGLMTLKSQGATLVHAYAIESANYNEAVFDATVEVDGSAVSGDPSDSDGNIQNGLSNSDDNSNQNGSIFNPENLSPDAIADQAEQIWNQVLATGDDSRYIIYTTLILGFSSLVLFIFILIKERKRY